MERIGSFPFTSRAKLVPMLVAPFLSRLSGSMQSRCVQRRNPRIFFPISASFSSHGPHEPRQRQHVDGRGGGGEDEGGMRAGSPGGKARADGRAEGASWVDGWGWCMLLVSFSDLLQPLQHLQNF